MLSSHNGVVLCVRFSGDSRYLASGSDDKVIVIWEMDESGYSGKVFGTDEVNVESWKAKKRLLGHENDVQDLCWSPNSSKLVSVGLDCAVMVWSTETFSSLFFVLAYISLFLSSFA